ncbi:MAG: thioesterase family protein [Alphaproteobacteria bacterium]
MSTIATPVVGRELYRGNVNTWECDEMGHMNVRFYVSKAQEALAILGHHLGLGPTHQRETGTALTVSDHHIRFLREMHAGTGLYVCGGVVEHGQDWLQVYLEIRNAHTHEATATFTTLVHHTDPDMGARIPLPYSVSPALKADRVAIPDHARPRGMALDAPSGTASLARAEELGMPVISHGVVQRSQCNENGLMHTQHFIGRVSDGIVNFMPTLLTDGSNARTPGKVGGAAVEYRMCYARRPRAGDIVIVRSGLKSLGERTFHLVHWILDGVTGEAFATSEAVALSLDLEARKSLPIDPERRSFMETKIVPGLMI